MIGTPKGEEMAILNNISLISVIRRWSQSLVSTPVTFLNNGTYRNRTRNLQNLNIRIFEGLCHLAKTFIRIMARTFAPLRRIVARELEVFEYDRILKIPQSFVIHDRLECGHVQDCLTWETFDLLNPYTQNPEVKARHHRCRPCASLLLDRKPVQSVGLTSKSEVA